MLPARVPEVPVMSTIGSRDACVPASARGWPRARTQESFVLGMACGVVDPCATGWPVTQEQVYGLLDQITL